VSVNNPARIRAGVAEMGDIPHTVLSMAISGTPLGSESAQGGETAHEGAGCDMPTWDLEPLLQGFTVDELLSRAEGVAAQMEIVRGRIGAMSAEELAVVFRAYAQIGDMLGRAMSYANLRHWRDTSDHEAAAMMQHVEERSVEITAPLAFLDIEWAEVPDERADQLMGHRALAFCANHLEGMRAYGPHQLTEGEERLDAERSVSGASAWARLFEELEAEMVVEMPQDDGSSVTVALEEATSLLEAKDERTRKLAYDAITKSLEQGLRTRAFIYNTVMLDRHISDRVRNFPTWVSAWNLENDAEDEHIDALIAAVKSRYDIAQRWYRLKAVLLGKDVLDDWDRNAPIGSEESAIDFDRGFEIVKSAYADFSPVMGRIVKEFRARGWIDAAVREHKAAGAFCDYTVASANPFVMLNWTNRRSDVVTLAHELGHGIHAFVSREQGFYHQETGMMVAETASVFGETITFEHLLADCNDPAERLALMAQRCDDTINTVFRQAALFSFEDRAHNIRREDGELSTDELAEVWLEAQQELLGDTVRLSDDAGSRWSYINHFFTAPGYVSAYPFGQLLALSVFAQYKRNPDGFALKLLNVLRAGGSRSAEELAAMVELDLCADDFWHQGLAIIEQQVEEAESAAREMGLIP
jgi:oligoendopeptidase F